MSRRTSSGRPESTCPSHRSYAWSLTTMLVVAVGLVVSVMSAGAATRHHNLHEMESFEHESAHIATTLRSAIQHQHDVVLDAGGLLVEPQLFQSRFARWATGAQVLERYPEMARIGGAVLVKNTDLPAFAAQAQEDPAGTLDANGHFTVTPSGTRRFYCFAAAALSRSSEPDAPAAFDFCADPAIRASLLASRDSGRGAYSPYPTPEKTWLAIQTPIYLGGATPPTLKARRAAFVGWVGTQVDPASLLAQAIQHVPGFAAEMRYRLAPTDTAFTSGPVPAGAASATINLDDQWTVTIYGRLRMASIRNGDALLVLVAGFITTGLLALLMFVLITGRERARRQVVQRTSQLHHQSLHDALTGLPNRGLVMDRIEQMLARDRRQATRGALLFLDLDDFKNVNDTLGHGAGDKLLIAVTDRLASTLRGADTIGRMGGDEFVILIEDTMLDAAPERAAERLLEVMQQPFELDDVTLPLTVNISIGIAAGDRDNAGELLRDADVALYQAKAAGKNRYEMFDPQMQTTLSRRTDLEFDLRSALSGNQYRLVYQPIYDLDSLTVVGVEALLRWDHPVRGLVGPDEFIPILEQTGQIREVGRWVLHEACRQMATWHQRGDTLDVSVNVSARQLDHDDLTDDIRHALQESGLAPAALIIEVTETALMDSLEATARRLHAIKELGVRIAVDDFGTGYSSLAYLQQFPVDSIKIDRAFTSAVTTSPESRALVCTLVQLGKDLGLSTLAEGVETTEEMDILRDTDVNQAQGFLLARPLSPETLEEEFLAPTRPTALSTGA